MTAKDAALGTDAAITLAKIAHDLVPGIRHDIGLVMLDALDADPAAWDTLIRYRLTPRLGGVLMEYDAGRLAVAEYPGFAVSPGGKPTAFHRAWAAAILAALSESKT